MSVVQVIRQAAAPARKPKGEVKAALALLEVGDAIDWNGSRHSVLAAARRMGVRVRTECRSPGLFRIWRTE